MASKDDEKTTSKTASGSQPGTGASADPQPSAAKTDETPKADGAAKDEPKPTQPAASTPAKAKTGIGSRSRRAADHADTDPRLDNRTGAQRPPLEDFPAKPQQVDGPDVTDEPDRTARPHAVDNDRPRKGMRSEGPHGLGDTADQV